VAAESKKAHPRVKASCTAITNGRSKIQIVKGAFNTNIMRKRTKRAGRKFTKFARTVERGKTSRVKRTFLIKWELPRMLPVDIITELEKKFHGKSAHRTKRGNLGRAEFGSIIVKTTVSTNIMKRGFRRVQRKPKAEFL